MNNKVINTNVLSNIGFRNTETKNNPINNVVIMTPEMRRNGITNSDWFSY